jgi:transposase
VKKERKNDMKQTDRSESGAMPRQKFDETYKRHAVELTLQGDRTVKTVAKELGLPSWQLYEWRKIYAPRPGDGGPPPQTLEEAEKEISRLRAELIRMREREIVLKKSVGILSETSESGMPGLRR